MSKEDELNEIILNYILKYPLLEIQDLVKLIYQNEFGVGHLIENEEKSLSGMINEVASHDAKPLTLFEKIDELMELSESINICIEGRSGSGKSTLATLLSAVYDCNVFHTYDFFLTP